MKKFLIFLLTLTLLTFPACSVGGADPVESESDTEAETLVPVHDRDCNNIPQALASEIKLAYREFINASYPSEKHSTEDIFIETYYGNYSDCEVVFIGDKLDFTEAHRITSVAGYVLDFPDGQLLYIYKNSTFYTIKDAYENDLLTKTDVYEIGQNAAFEIYDASEHPLG